MQVFVPVSHYKDTHNFDKINNYFKKGERKGDQVSDLLCPKLTELLYKVIGLRNKAKHSINGCFMPFR